MSGRASMASLALSNVHCNFKHTVQSILYGGIQISPFLPPDTMHCLLGEYATAAAPDS